MSEKYNVEWPVHGRVWVKSGNVTEDGRPMYVTKFPDSNDMARRAKAAKALATRRDILEAQRTTLEGDE